MARKKFYELAPGESFNFDGQSATGKFVKSKTTSRALNLDNWEVCIFNMNDEVEPIGKVSIVPHTKDKGK